MFSRPALFTVALLTLAPLVGCSAAPSLGPEAIVVTAEEAGAGPDKQGTSFFSYPDPRGIPVAAPSVLPLGAVSLLESVPLEMAPLEDVAPGKNSPVLVKQLRVDSAPAPAAPLSVRNSPADLAPEKPASKDLAPKKATPEKPVVVKPVLPVAPPESTVLEGTMVHSIWEPRSHGDHEGSEEHSEDESIQVSFVDTKDGLVQVNAALVEDIPTGVTVSIEAREYVAAQVSSDAEALASAGYQQISVSSTGAVSEVAPRRAVHDVTVVSVLPPKVAPSATTLAALVNQVNGPVNSYWSTQTEGEHTFRVVKSLERVAVSVGCEDSSRMWNEAAAKSGFVPGPNKHLLVFVPDTAPACAYGLATVGDTPNAGGRSYVIAPSTTLLIHELGHNLGLWHSSAHVCPSGSEGPVGPCAHREYHDAFDVMGSSGAYTGNLSGAQLSHLDARRNTRLDVAASVTTDVHPLSDAQGVRVVKVSVPRGSDYYVEYRANSGRDAEMTKDYRRPGYGVQVRRMNQDGSTSLLDPQWTGASDYQQALGAGASMVLAGGRLVVRVNSLSAMSANVSIIVDGVPPKLPSVNTLTLTSPTSQGVHDRRKGPVHVTGTASASEGTLLWQVEDAHTGQVAGSGFATTGVNGHVSAFDFFLEVPAGSWVLKVWVPSEADDSEAGVVPTNAVSVTFRTQF